VRVLHLNHTGSMSGAERSLLELLRGLGDEVSSILATPPGPFEDAARDQGAEVITIPAAEASFRIHPIWTPLALGSAGRAALAVARIARRERVDLIHANSARAALVARLVRSVGAPRAVVYLHDCLPDSRAANLTRRAILSGHGIVLANSDYTAASFAAGQHPAPAVRTSYNGMIDDAGRLVALNGAEPPSRPEARRRLGLEPEAPLVGLVAQISPWKGQDTAIEAFAGVRDAHPGAQLLLAGEPKFDARVTRFDNRAYMEHLRGLVAELDLGDAVSFLGERRDDAIDVIAALDVLVAPSWEEPFGRTIVEAMTIGTPVVATEVGGPAEIIEDGVTGRLVPPRAPAALAAAVSELLREREARERMVGAATVAAERFRLSTHVEEVVAAYRELLGSP